MFTYLEKKATAKLEQSIDAGNFSADQLIEIKIPLNMPYYSDKDYEPAYGEAEWNGQHYRYVKRKISGNTLYLLCIQNPDKNKIISEKNNFTKAAGEARQNNSPAKQHPSAIKLMLSEFIAQENKKTEILQLLTSSKKYLIDSGLISQFDPLATTQPPETIA